MDAVCVSFSNGVIGMSFPDEMYSVLFSPHSGDLLLCSTEDWKALKEKKQTNALSDLKTRLISLGVDIY